MMDRLLIASALALALALLALAVGSPALSWCAAALATVAFVVAGAITVRRLQLERQEVKRAQR
jgi:membrane protein implicated in regulation of membrane protease activity